MGKIELTPAELLTQSNELNILAQRYESLFSGVSSVLNNANTGWSDFLSNNFEGKINSAQKGFSGIVNALMKGSEVAHTSATSFESVDTLLAKLNLGESTAAAVIGSMISNGGTNNEEYIGFWDELRKKYESGQNIADYVRDYYEQLPDELKDTFDVDELEFVLDVMEQDFNEWTTLDVDPSIVEDIAKYCGLEGIYAKGISKVYDMIMNPENAGTFGELYTGQQWMEDEAIRLLSDGNYSEGLKMAATSAGIGIYAIFYGSFDALTEISTDIVEEGTDAIMEALDYVAEIVPGNTDNTIVDNAKTILDYGYDLIRDLF